MGDDQRGARREEMAVMMQAALEQEAETKPVPQENGHTDKAASSSSALPDEATNGHVSTEFKGQEEHFPPLNGVRNILSSML